MKLNKHLLHIFLGSALGITFTFSDSILNDLQHTKAATNEESVGWLDTASASIDQINLRGWSATNNSEGMTNRTLIFVDADDNYKELWRTNVDTVERDDVQAAYPDITNSKNSGFDLNIATPENLRGHRIVVVAEYNDENQNHTQYWFTNNPIKVPNYEKNVGTIDSMTTTDSELSIRGWFASSDSENLSNKSLIFVDANDNYKELARYSVNSEYRGDVKSVYPYLPNAEQSGFNLSIATPESIKGHRIVVVAENSDNYGNHVQHWFTDNPIDYSPQPVAPSSPDSNSQRDIITSTALAQVGKPYVWGATGPDSFDCSGLVQFSYQSAGISLNRTTTQQELQGEVIPVSEAKAGDIFFWGSRGSTYHDAIALSNNQYVQAPAPGQSVQVGYTQWYTPSFAVRVIN